MPRGLEYDHVNVRKRGFYVVRPNGYRKYSIVRFGKSQTGFALFLVILWFALLWAAMQMGAYDEYRTIAPTVALVFSFWISLRYLTGNLADGRVFFSGEWVFFRGKSLPKSYCHEPVFISDSELQRKGYVDWLLQIDPKYDLLPQFLSWIAVATFFVLLIRVVTWEHDLFVFSILVLVISGVFFLLLNARKFFVHAFVRHAEDLQNATNRIEWLAQSLSQRFGQGISRMDGSELAAIRADLDEFQRKVDEIGILSRRLQRYEALLPFGNVFPESRTAETLRTSSGAIMKNVGQFIAEASRSADVQIAAAHAAVEESAISHECGSAAIETAAVRLKSVSEGLEAARRQTEALEKILTAK